MVMPSGDTGPAPTIGARVATADGTELGTVKEVAGCCFKIDASMHVDYWLTKDRIASATESELLLGITEDEVGEAKVDAPANSGVQL